MFNGVYSRAAAGFLVSDPRALAAHAFYSRTGLASIEHHPLTTLWAFSEEGWYALHQQDTCYMRWGHGPHNLFLDDSDREAIASAYRTGVLFARKVRLLSPKDEGFLSWMDRLSHDNLE